MVDLAGWVASLDAVVELIAGRFGRVEPRRRVGAYLRGLLAGLERKNSWTLAEHAGAVSPDGMQRLLRTADWDVDGVRDDLRGYVLDQLGGRSGGVDRRRHRVHQERCPLCWGATPVHRYEREDRQLSVGGVFGLRQRAWSGVGGPRAPSADVVDRGSRSLRSRRHPSRCRVRDQAPAWDRHARPRPRRRCPVGWVTADEAFGQNRAFRGWLAAREVPFVLATRSDDILTCPDGHRYQTKQLAALIPDPAWERR